LEWPHWPRYWWWVSEVLVGVGAGRIGCRRDCVVHLSARRRGLLRVARPPSRIGRGLGCGAESLRAAAQLLRPSVFYPGFVIGIVAWVAEGFGLWLLLGWLGVGVDFTVGIGIYAAGMLAGAVSFLPGGLGGGETALALLIVEYGGSPAVAFVATLICRAATLGFAVTIGVVAIIGLELGSWRKPA
jgi:glycosyltransferase 2 family protein